MIGDLGVISGAAVDTNIDTFMRKSSNGTETVGGSVTVAVLTDVREYVKAGVHTVLYFDVNVWLLQT